MAMGTRFHLRENDEEPSWILFGGAMLMTLMLLPVALILNLFACLKAWVMSRAVEEHELGAKSAGPLKRAG
jgi:hypothetical protein